MTEMIMFVIVYFIFELNSDSELISIMIINDKKDLSYPIQTRRTIESIQTKHMRVSEFRRNAR